MLVDAHCHLTGSYLAANEVEATLARARAEGVTGFIAVGTDLEDSGRVLALARVVPGVQASLGVHPHEARTWEEGTGEALEGLLLDSNARFVGETGLDWHYDLSPRDQQERVFREQVRLARRLGKPLMIHTRSAPEATLCILKEEGAEAVSGIIHCFSEDLAFARGALELGSPGASGDPLPCKIPRPCRGGPAWGPGARTLVGTDAPFLAPVPYRGKPNEPGFVRFTANQVADLRGVSSTRIAELTTRNLEALCGWAPAS